MKFSVIIINYNYANYLERAIFSVAGQILAPHEIIFVDDGSTDHSLDVIRPLLPKIPTLRLHTQKNGGQLAAVRSGVESATGDWVFFLDSDDEWKSAHLSLAQACLDRHSDMTLYFSGHEETAGPPLFRSKWPEGLFGPCSGLVAATGTRTGTIESTLGLRTDIARQALSFPSSIDSQWRMRAEDCLIFGASLCGAIVYYNPFPSVIYRIHGKNSFAGINQSAKEAIYNQNKSDLFAYWMGLFGIDANHLAERIFKECTMHANNRRNPIVRRRSLRAIRTAPGFWPTKALLAFRLLFTRPSI